MVTNISKNVFLVARKASKRAVYLANNGRPREIRDDGCLPIVIAYRQPLALRREMQVFQRMPIIDPRPNTIDLPFFPGAQIENVQALVRRHRGGMTTIRRPF